MLIFRCSHQIKELLKAIPSHCYKRSLWKSSAYVVWDFCLIAAFAYAASHINTYLDHDGAFLDGNAGVAAKAAAWATYCGSLSVGEMVFAAGFG